MFGYRLIHKDELKLLRRLEAMSWRLPTANRWLAEFDWLLKPLWEFLVVDNPQDVRDVREQMRKAKPT